QALPLSAGTPQGFTWLWKDRIAFGKLALLEGDPELGKSLIALDLCARLSTGRAMPDGSPGREPCNVIVLNGEDDPADTTRPRLAGLGADLERVFIVASDDSDTPVRLPDDFEPLDDLLTQTR